MRLIRLVKLLAVVVATTVVLTQNMASARALIALPAPVSPAQAVTSATTIVIGKVTSISKDMVEVTAFEGAPKDQPKQPYKVATIKISEALMGAKGLTEIKVGFPANAAAPGAGGVGPDVDLPIKGRPIRPGIGFGAVALTEGQEGVFMLSRHWDGEFYILAGGFNAAPIDKKNPNYDKQLAEVKKIIAVLKDPISALKSKEKDERFTAVSVLTNKYRNWNKPTPFVEENLPAEESKLILDVILEMPWAPKPDETNPDYNKTLSNAFGIWLGNEQGRLKFQYPQIKPGTPPEEINKLYEESVVKFIKENRDKFVLKRFVEKK
ncbi:MAG: hypothetical protein N2112_06740 [Gemmataceae bacterium]|jgi:hypothetical protein|nr:hypothetical protein [Gemmataceae bacterium]